MHDYRFQESVPPSLSEFLVILPSHHEIPEEPWCRILHACEIPLFLPTGDSVDTTMGDAVDTLLFYKSAVGLTYQLYRNSNLLFQQNLKVSLAQISSITALSTRILPPLTGTSTAGSRQEVVMHIGYSDGRVEAHRLLNYQTSAVSLLRLFSVGASSKGVLNEPVLEIVAQNDELYIQQPREITRFRGYFGMLRQMLYSEDAKKEMNKLDLVKDSLCPRGQDWGCLHMTIGANIIYVYNELGGLKNYRASTHEQIDIQQPAEYKGSQENTTDIFLQILKLKETEHEDIIVANSQNEVLFGYTRWGMDRYCGFKSFATAIVSRKQGPTEEVWVGDLYGFLSYFVRKWGEGEESQGETGMYTIRYAKKVCELGIRKLLVLSHLAIVEDCEANIRLYDIVRENSL